MSTASAKKLENVIKRQFQALNEKGTRFPELSHSTTIFEITSFNYEIEHHYQLVNGYVLSPQRGFQLKLTKMLMEGKQNVLVCGGQGKSTFLRMVE